MHEHLNCNANHKQNPFLISATSGSDQQSELNKCNSNLGFSIGEIAEWNNNGDCKFVEIVEIVPSVDSSVLFKARVLNTNDETIVHHNSLSNILPIASIPNEFEELDIDRVENAMSSDDLERLWNQQANPLNDDERLCQHWHDRLQHPPKITMKRLAERGIIPRHLAKLKSHPICAACVFATAHKRP